jgi:hypothetical protein
MTYTDADHRLDLMYEHYHERALGIRSYLVWTPDKFADTHDFYAKVMLCADRDGVHGIEVHVVGVMDSAGLREPTKEERAAVRGWDWSVVVEERTE